ncbi:MAG: hypothetical protein WB587_04410, partial [Nitrososphaeraceae archaeon]
YRRCEESENKKDTSFLLQIINRTLLMYTGREWVYPQFQEYERAVPLHPVVYERLTSLGVIYLI